MTGLIKMRRTSDIKISPKKKKKKQHQTGGNGLNGEDEEDERKEETCGKFRFSDVKQNLVSIISFVDCNPQYNKYYLMLKEMRQDVVKEHYKRGTQPKTSSFFKHGFNNTKYVGYQKCF
jgi:hypothetical protein